MKFKIGDWVSYYNGFKDVLFQIKEFDCEGRIKHDCNRFKEEYLKLWKPKQGEWCWFWNKNRIPTIGQFLSIETDGNLKYSATFPNTPHTMIGYYKYCEPFIGELPSFIKEIHGTK